MISRKPLFACTLLSLLAAPAWAQKTAADSVLKGSTIEVIQSYKPQVRQAPKPEWLPHLPPADTSRPSLTYEVPQQTLYYSYTSEPLRPLALGIDTFSKPFSNYVKAGAGNLSTLYLDAGIGGISGKNYETAIHLHHNSQKGSLKSQQSAISGLEANGILHTASHVWKANIDVERNQFYYYGFDRTIYPDNEDSLKQTYSLVRLGASASNLVAYKGVYYQPSVMASIFNARNKTNEYSFGFKAPFQYKIDSNLEARLNIDATITKYQVDPNTLSANNNLLLVQPGLKLTKNRLRGHGYLGFATGKGNIYVLPDVLAQYNIANTSLVLSGGWQATVRRNTYEEMATENPFVASYYIVKQSRRDELFVNVSGAWKKHFTYNVKASWWNFGNLAMFANSWSKQGFNVVYDDISALSLHGGARYEHSAIWSAGLAVDYYSYYKGNLPKVINMPTLILKGDLSVVPLKHLVVSGYASLLGGMVGFDSKGKEVSISPNVDIGGAAEYEILSRLNVFAQLNNILNNKYERWIGYQSYGLNVFGGVRLKF